MKFKARILNFDIADSYGDVFPGDGKLDFSEQPVYVRDYGDNQMIPQGEATIERKEGFLEAEITVYDDSSMKKLIDGLKAAGTSFKLYPAVNGVVIERDGANIKYAKILSIDISPAGNVDRTIPPLDLNQGYDDNLENKPTN